jgi:hypothetical protein
MPDGAQGIGGGAWRRDAAAPLRRPVHSCRALAPSARRETRLPQEETATAATGAEPGRSSRRSSSSAPVSPAPDLRTFQAKRSACSPSATAGPRQNTSMMCRPARMASSGIACMAAGDPGRGQAAGHATV